MSADKFADKFGCIIKEWTLNPFEKELSPNYKPYFVRMDRCGNIIACCIEKDCYCYDIVSGKDHASFDINCNMRMSFMARSRKHAIRKADKKRLSLISLGKWPE